MPYDRLDILLNSSFVQDAMKKQMARHNIDKYLIYECFVFAKLAIFSEVHKRILVNCLDVAKANLPGNPHGYRVS